MNFSTVCRTCLATDNLSSIFALVHDFDIAVYLATGIKVELNDGLPEKMCANCINFVKDSIKFRNKCKETENTLLKIKEEISEHLEVNIECESTDKDINKINIIKVQTLDVKIESENSGKKFEVKSERYVRDSSDEDERPLKYLQKNVTDTSDNIDSLMKSIVLFVEKSDGDRIPQSFKLTEGNEKIEKSHQQSSESSLNQGTSRMFDENMCTFLKKQQLHSEIDTDRPYETDSDAEHGNKRVTCKLCQKNLSIRSIDAHMSRRHPGADTRRVKCEFCDTFILKDKMNRHKKMMHGPGCYRCGYCKSNFDNKDLLQEHVTNCSAKKKRRNINDSSRELRECDICHKIMQKASLKMHKAIKHAGLGPVCEHCGLRFGNKFRLNEHYRAKHGYEKFKCSHCDFQSAGIMAMRNHERRHRGEKPFVCETCGAKFHAAYLLTQHKQSHRTERLVKCDQCPARFKANNSLHMHKLTCHSKSLFKCTMCSRAYSCRHYAVKHLRHVHRYRGPVPPLQKITSNYEANEEARAATLQADS